MKKILCVVSLLPAAALAQIQPESIGTIETLPDSYPPHWIIAQDGSFFHMSDGKFHVLDADSDDPVGRYKGVFNGSFIPMFHQATTRPEMYIVETYRSRGTRGERTDVLTVYAKSTLAPVGEVVIPPKRATGMPTEYHLQTIDDERLALVYNFTPAQSVSVVDVVAREFLSEIPIPGCALVYPMRGRSFATLCGDGTMLRVELDENGQQVSAERTDAFFDPENDPIMEKAALIDGHAYFPTFQGDVVPVDLRRDMPRPDEPWSLIGAEPGGWRPGGLQMTGSDADGNLYVLMHPDGYDGSHKDPGIEVWVFDTSRERRINRIGLQMPAISFAVTRDDEPLLVATNINLEIDVYDVNSGSHLRTIGNFGHQTPFLLHGGM